ncbi:hypothetical protein F5876DRAFT_62572 [Lentinula aff. lateritia]|uniref:Uncharacterized protein n=1 Tax=Lentinula aff. lateritia TaxID=2804960 RepID=A0ACC1UBF8_9AGAR|nr:hypothetical protein F5876DRAFT_62572 [Lentinula aff. lateritia]
MKFSISTTYAVLSLLFAYVNANPVQLLSNIAIGVPRDQTAESRSTTPDPTHFRRSAISVSFEKGAELSPTELSKTQEEARDKVQQFIIAAEGKLHTSGWVINWLNNPPKKVKPNTDQIKFGFTGPAVCTGEILMSPRATGGLGEIKYGHAALRSQRMGVAGSFKVKCVKSEIVKTRFLNRFERNTGGFSTRAVRSIRTVQVLGLID